MNSVTFLGNLTKDIKIFYKSDGLAVSKTAIAVNNRRDDSVLYIDLVFFGGLGEVADKYLRKGSKILVQGKLDLYQYTDQQGNKRQKHSVICQELEMLDSKHTFTADSTNYSPPNIDINEDEIPF